MAGLARRAEEARRGLTRAGAQPKRKGTVADTAPLYESLTITMDGHRTEGFLGRKRGLVAETLDGAVEFDFAWIGVHKLNPTIRPGGDRGEVLP